MGCLVFRSGYQTCQEYLWSFFYVGPGCFCAESDPKRQRKVCCFQELYFFVLSLVSNPLRALNTNQPNTILEQKIPPQTCWHEVSIPSPQGWYTPCWLSQRWWSRVYVTKLSGFMQNPSTSVCWTILFSKDLLRKIVLALKIQTNPTGILGLCSRQTLKNVSLCVKSGADVGKGSLHLFKIWVKHEDYSSSTVSECLEDVMCIRCLVQNPP